MKLKTLKDMECKGETHGIRVNIEPSGNFIIIHYWNYYEDYIMRNRFIPISLINEVEYIKK